MPSPLTCSAVRPVEHTSGSSPVGLDAAAVVVVVVAVSPSTGATVVVAAGSTVVVVAGSVTTLGSSAASTGRNWSSAVWPTRAMARSLSFTPGIWMRMLSPWRVISGSATPRASTRWRMMAMASLMVSLSVSPLGWSTTDTPPWRSRPSSGLLPAAKV